MDCHGARGVYRVAEAESGRTNRCPHAGGNAGFEIDVTRARRVTLVVRRRRARGWPAQDEEAAWAMTALAAKLLGAKSVYRTPDEPRHVFLLDTGVRWASGT